MFVFGSVFLARCRGVKTSVGLRASGGFFIFMFFNVFKYFDEDAQEGGENSGFY